MNRFYSTMDLSTNLKKNNLNTQFVGNPSKEKEFVGRSDSLVKEISGEVEVSKEVEQSGVVVNKEKIEIPPDLQSIGLKHTGISVPVNHTSALNLPLPDEKIEAGSHASVFSSIRWLATWCLLQMKRFHLTLKVIHGKVMRVRYKQ